ncbi:hypothetical protein H5410_058425 [Solanum commersonii]|uniref:Uncharacterized protein n=1 Tax=Solanum commersonii TaxID=4109 RepID=A0A9J5WQR5_SOLCO|nr:hypothetical protein H5410_058425 [Solanum commersonii]
MIFLKYSPPCKLCNVQSCYVRLVLSSDSCIHMDNFGFCKDVFYQAVNSTLCPQTSDKYWKPISITFASSTIVVLAHLVVRPGCPQLTKSSVDVDFVCLWLYNSAAFIVDEHLRNGEQVCFASPWYYMVLPGAKLGVYLPFLVLNKSLCCIIPISKL